MSASNHPLFQVQPKYTIIRKGFKAKILADAFCGSLFLLAQTAQWLQSRNLVPPVAGGMQQRRSATCIL